MCHTHDNIFDYLISYLHRLSFRKRSLILEKLEKKITGNFKKDLISSRCFTLSLRACIFSMHIERIHCAFMRFRCTIHKIERREYL